jgi:hypothetical protein
MPEWHKVYKMTKSTGTTATKKATFAWDDKNAVIVKDAYLAEIATGSDLHNDKKFLADLAVLVGAKSGASVRAKLCSLKVYAKSETATTSGKPAKIKATKVSTVYNIEAILNLAKESLDTLEKANAKALETLTDAIIALGTDDAINKAYFELQDRILEEQNALKERAELTENEADYTDEEMAEMAEINELANAF